MTEPVPDKRGFEHKNVFYEYVPLEEWLNRDFTLARTLTRVGIDDLLAGGRDYNAIQQASLAVAVWHQNPEQQMDRIIAFVNTIKPADVNEVGFKDDPEDDAGPPEDPASSATHSDSPETGENSSEQS